MMKKKLTIEQQVEYMRDHSGISFDIIYKETIIVEPKRKPS